ncbi:Glutamate receptor isoform 1 [Hibiscus syriacus]|uniref:Glutamate receptor isoform 1 n=1 Tax=Hibiscus syriacus TaxID=106335 RepID=A0A6A2X8I1_HIBSY|nr:septum-promoting GTP-binding protein 1-like [Hibiscus syriacus]KAE8654709.1 Glutamate receptor isoform 1 [Hibiscus syriacus]
MTQFCPKLVKLNLRRRFQRRVLILRRCIRGFWDRLLVCSLGKPMKTTRYRILAANPSASSPPPPHSASARGGEASVCHHGQHDRKDSDLVQLKISLLGDPQTGKTSFLMKYIGDENEDVQEDTQQKGLNLMDKTFFVSGARIYYCIWEVDGADKSQDHLPLACKDSVAILFMFDLTSRCTLNNIISWYQEARKWNQTAIPILIGTKFDDFTDLPLDLQWTIAGQARAYAKAINATLFFSSATYNINVSKIFKFITAKLFDLPWTVERNLNIGEPIIDF